MSIEEKKDTQDNESKTPEGEPTEPIKVEQESTIGETLDNEPVKKNTIPEAAFLQEKKGRKEAEKRIKELENLIAEGGTKEEVSDDIDAIADEHGIDKQFLQKLSKALIARSTPAKEIQKEEKEEVTEVRETAGERETRIDRAFQKGFSQAIEKFPELTEIVNAETIKQLSLIPRNQKKTFSQLIEETYGNARVGKRTIETPTPNGGKEPEEIDFDRAKKDAGYFSEIMNNPKMKSAYNKNLIFGSRL